MEYIPKKEQEYLNVLEEKTSGMTSEEREQYLAGEFPDVEGAVSYESLRGQRVAVRDVKRFF